MHVSMVPREHIEKIREVCVEHLRTLERYTLGRYTANDIIDKCIDGEQNLLIAFDDDGEIHGCLTFSIIPYPRKTMLRIISLAGNDLKDWKDNMYSLVEKIGKGENCAGQEWLGRAGWVKMFPDMTPTAVFMEKEY
jgi:hypothetical protein